MPSVDVYAVTFNCGREQVKPEVFARHLFGALSKPRAPEILILSLQEVAPIAYAFLGGSFLASYFDRFRHAVRLAAASLGEGRYVNFVTRNVGMTVIMAFVLEGQMEHIRFLEAGGVGVGVREMGNKGAVGVRFDYSVGDKAMELSAVAAHLAPMENALERRNQDWKNIVQRLVFNPVDPIAARNAQGQSISPAGNDDSAPLLAETPSPFAAANSCLYKPTSYIILAGDLNYRSSHLKPSPLDIQTFPQPTEDVRDPRHFSHLLKRDQLARELEAQKTCHGLQEAEITFPPTYKFSDRQQAIADIDDGLKWDWAKHRWPSWCDRILYLEAPPWTKAERSQVSVTVHAYTALPLMSTSDHRPVALSLSIPLTAPPAAEDEAPEPEIRIRSPFPMDPAWRERREQARRRELLVGFTSYLGLTWEGNGILLAIALGALGGWAIVRNMLG